jgi:hypothetical protein
MGPQKKKDKKKKKQTRVHQKLSQLPTIWKGA